MATPRQTLETEIKSALRAGDKRRLSTLRLLLTAVDNERIRTGEEVDEQTLIRLVQKSIKQRLESAAQYRKGEREELAAGEEAEAEILAEFLPPQIGEEELERRVRAYVEENALSGPSAIGQVMREMMSRYAGRTEGATINRIAREVLGRRDA